MNWYKQVLLRDYATFSGRARRREYWYFSLGNLIAVCVRRLHDTGRSGWWMLVSAIPLVGFLVILYFTVLDSEPGANKYGPNPKGVIRQLPEPAVSPG